LARIHFYFGVWPEAWLVSNHAESQSYLAIQPLVAIAPGAAIMLAVIGFNLLGVGIKRLISERQQG